MTRRSRHILAAISVAVVAIATGFVAIHLAGAPAAPAPAVGEGEMPPALARHLERLKALPGNQGMSLEGPGGAAEAAYFARAYPADTISVAQVQAAKAAFTASKGKPFPHGKGQKGTWTSVGPSSALYPSSEFLNSFLYVPNAYIAGGRTTAIAIADNCSQQSVSRVDQHGWWRHLAHRQGLLQQPQVGLSRRPAGNQLHRCDNHRQE